ncbi:hypothetical protein Tco_1256610 [Tanacetum coccineum]
MLFIYRGVLGKAWYWKMKILRSVLFRKERMAGPKENRVKVAEKEETGKFHGSPDGGPVLILSSISVLMGDFEFLGCFSRVRRCREEGIRFNRFKGDILGASWKRATKADTKHDIGPTFR